LHGAVTAGDVLGDFYKNHAVQSGFGRKKSGFMPFIVVRMQAEQIHPASAAGQRRDSDVRESVVVAGSFCVFRKMRVETAVRLYQASSDSENWKQPNGIGRPEFAGTAPNLLLIEPEIFPHQ